MAEKRVGVVLAGCGHLDGAEIHEAVMATSPNFYNVSRPVALKPTLVVE